MARKTPIVKERARPREVRKPASSARRLAGRWTYSLPFRRLHYMLFGIGLAVILAGYVALGQGSITIAPLLLVIGYCILIPFVFIVKGKVEREKDERIET